VVCWALWTFLIASLVSDAGVRYVAHPVIGSVVLAAVLFFLIYVALRAARRRTPATLAVAVLASLAFSAPIPLKWDDDCNRHSGWTYGITVPYVLSKRPVDSRVVFDGYQTLMRCLPPTMA
jgi:hypothetical protein